MTALAVALCVAYVDRPVASWVHSTFSAPYYRWMDRFYMVLLVGGGILGAIAVVNGIRSLMRRSLDRSTLTLASWAAVAALITAELLKLLFGRTDPYPSYVEQGVYTFRPFAKGVFPSGTTSFVAALATILAVRLPGRRVLWVSLAALIAVSLPLTNSHWVSDVIAAAFLGAFIGKLTLQL